MTDERKPEGEPGSTTEPIEPGSTTEPIEPPPATPTWDAPASPTPPAPSWEAPAASAPTAPPPPPLAPLVDPATQQTPAVSMAPGGPGAPAAAQPAVAWAAPAAVVDAKGKRTFLAGIAGVLLLIGGILGILLGLLVAVVGGAFFANFERFGGGFPEFPELEGADPGAVFGGVIAFFGFIVVAYSVAYLLAGIGVLRNSNWARVLGLVVGIISGLIWLSGVSQANLTDAGGGAGSMVFAIVMLAIHAYIVVALLLFWRDKPSAA